MSFCSLGFPAFFILALLAFWLAPPRARTAVLLGANLLFLASMGGSSLLVLAVVTVLTWACGRGIATAAPPTARRGWLVLGLAASAGYLFARKAVGLLAPGFSPLGAVGLAFYALQAAGYLVDVAAGRCKAQKNLLRYAAFVSFFPSLVSGPISRAETFFPQLRALQSGRRGFDAAAARAGLVTMLCGYAQKLILADPLSAVVNTVFADYAQYSGAAILCAVLAQGFALYFDFAGYSAIAIGAARVLGFELPANFCRPYLAQSLSGFWDRWHISLSTWLRDYIYIPLGGNRLGKTRKYLNLLATFLVSGLWHGTGWHYLFWGAFHAGAQSLEAARRPGRAAVWARRLGVLAVVDLGWLFFRAASLRDGFAMLWRMAAHFAPATLWDGTLLTLGLDKNEWLVVLAALALTFVLELTAEAAARAKTTLYARFAALPRAAQVTLLLPLAVAVLLFACRAVGGDVGSFYYAQF